jgi:branched-chain amino acid transport system substrate-binding protein
MRLENCIWKALLLLLSTAVWFGTPAPAAAAEDPIIVGAPIPRASGYGQNGERGMVLATEEINAAGGVSLGGKKRPIKLEIIDSRDEEPGVPARDVLLSIEKLILDTKADLIAGGPCMSECSIAAMDLYARYGIVDIVGIGSYTPTWDQKVAENKDKYKHSFRASGSVKWYVKEALDLLTSLKEKHGFSKMFISIDDSLMCRKAAEIVETKAKAMGWEITGVDKHPIGTTDYTVPLIECKKSGAQVLFIWAYAPETSIMIKQWADLEVPALPLGFIGAAEDPGFWKATGGKAAYTVVNLSEAGATLSDVTPKSRAYYQAYEKRWGVPPRSTGSVSGYETMYILADAIERAGSLDKPAIIAALEKTSLPLVRGTVRFDENHQIVYGYDPQTSVLGNWIQWQDEQRVTIFPKAAATGELKLPPWMNKK